MLASNCSGVSAVAEHPENLPNPVIFKSLSKSPEHERPEWSCLPLSAGCVQPSGREGGKKMNNTKSKSPNCQWRVVQNKAFKGEKDSLENIMSSLCHWKYIQRCISWLLLTGTDLNIWWTETFFLALKDSPRKWSCKQKITMHCNGIEFKVTRKEILTLVSLEKIPKNWIVRAFFLFRLIFNWHIKVERVWGSLQCSYT